MSASFAAVFPIDLNERVMAPTISENFFSRALSMPVRFSVVVVLIAIASSCADARQANSTLSDSAGDKKIKVLIIDGQNNHTAWPQTTVMMKQYLEETGKFAVDVERTVFTWRGGELLEQYPLDDGKEYQDLDKPKTDPNFSPNFADYDVIVSNFGFNAAPWPDETKKNFEAYMAGGGGLVVVHAADNAWGDWKAFNEMIGVGGWGGRNEKSGPYIYVDDEGNEIRDTSKGNGGAHGPQHEYQIVSRKADHPIMRGLPTAWMHTKDELYERLRGPGENMTILATAYASEKFRGSGNHEPIVMVLDYEDGRVFHTTMGHAGYSMECVGYKTLFIRGTEWAATGEVSLTDIPSDFPTDKASSKNVFELKKVDDSSQPSDPAKVQK